MRIFLSKWVRRVAVCLLTIAGGCCIAGAEALDVAFYNSGFSGNVMPTGPAFVGQAGDQWNWIDASNCPGCPGPVSLVDTDGNGTSATLSFTADGSVPSATVETQPDPDLTNNYLFNNSGGAVTITLNGLVPNFNYLLVMYVSSDDSAGGQRSLAGTANGEPFTATGDPQSTFVNGEISWI